MIHTKFQDLIAGLITLFSGYAGSTFLYFTSGAISELWWFKLLLVVVPSVITGLAVIANTCVRHYLEVRNGGVRLPADPRPGVLTPKPGPSD